MPANEDSLEGKSLLLLCKQRRGHGGGVARKEERTRSPQSPRRSGQCGSNGTSQEWRQLPGEGTDPAHGHGATRACPPTLSSPRPSFPHILWPAPSTWLALFPKHTHSTHVDQALTKAMLFILRTTLQGRSPCPPFTEKETEEEVRQSQNSNPGGQLVPTAVSPAPQESLQDICSSRRLQHHLLQKAFRASSSSP